MSNYRKSKAIYFGTKLGIYFIFRLILQEFYFKIKKQTKQKTTKIETNKIITKNSIFSKLSKKNIARLGKIRKTNYKNLLDKNKFLSYELCIRSKFETIKTKPNQTKPKPIEKNQTTK